MSDIAIRVENLGKSYQISHTTRGRYKTLQEDLLGFLQRPFSRSDNTYSRNETFWALKDLSFEVRHGEVLGIIGRNGAGKSTLLKILSRITRPTVGYAEVFGRIGSLLEVGTGFHPELTGRENIFLNGAILGMTRREIQRRFDEIVDFAEVEQFLDTPVKRYSSGMYMRLAFAVAAHLDPEILVVDEVLAVGDAKFQEKCLGKMSEVARGGRTVLFVSHNMAAVSNLCQRVILLDAGQIQLDDVPSAVIRHYVSANHDHERSNGYVDLTQRVNKYGTGHIFIRDVYLRNAHGQTTSIFEMGESLTLEFTVQNLDRYPQAFPGVSVDTIEGIRILGVNTAMMGWQLPTERCPVERIVCSIPNLNITPGVYRVNLSLTNVNEYLDRVESSVDITILESDVYRTGFKVTRDYGLIYVNAAWELHSESETSLIG